MIFQRRCLAWGVVVVTAGFVAGCALFGRTRNHSSVSPIIKIWRSPPRPLPLLATAMPILPSQHVYADAVSEAASAHLIKGMSEVWGEQNDRLRLIFGEDQNTDIVVEGSWLRLDHRCHGLWRRRCSCRMSIDVRLVDATHNQVSVSARADRTKEISCESLAREVGHDLAEAIEREWFRAEWNQENKGRDEP